MMSGIKNIRGAISVAIGVVVISLTGCIAVPRIVSPPTGQVRVIEHNTHEPVADVLVSVQYDRASYRPSYLYWGDGSGKEYRETAFATYYTFTDTNGLCSIPWWSCNVSGKIYTPVRIWEVPRVTVVLSKPGFQTDGYGRKKDAPGFASAYIEKGIDPENTLRIFRSAGGIDTTTVQRISAQGSPLHFGDRGRLKHLLKMKPE